MTCVPKLLDCTSRETTLESLAVTAGVSAADVAVAIESVSIDELNATGDPDRALASMAARRLGVENFEGFTHVRFFHGTRTVDPERFRQHGLLPLPEAVELIWADLRQIGRDVLDGRGFDRLRSIMEAGNVGHFAHLYAMKTTDAIHHGPWATLVREEHLRPDELSNHDYLGTPEVVADIMITASEVLGVQVDHLYRAATAPCLVSFDMPATHLDYAVPAACSYVRDRSHGGLSRASSWGFDGHGLAVPADAIRTIEAMPSLTD